MTKTLASLLLLTAVASADTKKTDVLRWDAFPGPEAEPAALAQEAFVVSPVQSGTWTGGLSFVLAPVVTAEPHALIVQGPFSQFAVPAAFVAPAVKPQKIRVGSYVLFQQNATMTMTMDFGRVTKVGKDTVTITHKFVDVETDDIPASHVMLLDGKLAWGAPVTFELDGKHVLGRYVAPGRDPQHTWVLSVGKPFEVEGVKPLKVRAFAKGEKVQAVFGTTSVLTLKDGKQPPARQILEPGTITAVLNGGVVYKIKNPDGEIQELDLGEVFSR